MKNIFALQDSDYELEKLKSGLGIKEQNRTLLKLGEELKETEAKLNQVLSSEEVYVNDICQHLLQAEGKRLRPTLVFLAGQFGDYDLKNLIPLATAVEILHMATLIHDDIIDKADMRRGIPTISKAWDEDIAILMGDYLYGKTLILLASLGERVIIDFSRIVTKLIEGEMEQKANLFNPDVSLEGYYKRIHNKTAFFIAQCCSLGAIVCNGAPGDAKLLANFGNCLGMAFQIQDDLLDFTEEKVTVGKPVNEDLKRGVLTLPVIYALNNSKRKEELKAIIKKGHFTNKEWQQILEEVYITDAINYSKKLARYYALKAREWIKILPDGPSKNSLEFLTYFVTERKK